MIQDIAPHIYKNKYEPVEARGNDFLLVYDGKNVLVGETEEGICFPQVSQITAPEKCIYLFSIDEKRFYLGNKEMFDRLEGFAWEIFRFTERRIQSITVLQSLQDGSFIAGMRREDSVVAAEIQWSMMQKNV